MFVQDPSGEAQKVEEELRVWKRARRLELERLLGSAGKAVVDLGDGGCGGSCECGGSNQQGLSARVGEKSGCGCGGNRPVTGHKAWSRTGGVQSTGLDEEGEVEEEAVNAGFFSQIEAPQVEHLGPSCERFIPPLDDDWSKWGPTTNNSQLWTYGGEGGSLSSKLKEKVIDEDGEPLQTLYEIRDGNMELPDVVYHNEWLGIECGDKMSPSGCLVRDPCAAAPPCIDRQSEEDFLNTNFDAAADRFSVRWISQADLANKEAESSLMRVSLGLLIRNVDIVEWIERRQVRKSNGTPYARPRIADFLEGQGSKVKVNLCGKADGTFCRSKFSAQGGVWRAVWVTQKTLASKYLDAWMSPNSENPNRDRLAIAIDLSGTILHELCHVFEYPVDPPQDAPRRCNITYLIENMYRWAMFTRYQVYEYLNDVDYRSRPITKCFMDERGTVVNDYDIIEMFGKDRSVFPTRSCVGDRPVPFDPRLEG